MSLSFKRKYKKIKKEKWWPNEEIIIELALHQFCIMLGDNHFIAIWRTIVWAPTSWALPKLFGSSRFLHALFQWDVEQEGRYVWLKTQCKHLSSNLDDRFFTLPSRQNSVQDRYTKCSFEKDIIALTSDIDFCSTFIKNEHPHPLVLENDQWPNQQGLYDYFLNSEKALRTWVRSESESDKKRI